MINFVWKFGDELLSVHCRYLHYNIMVRVHAHAALLRIQIQEINKY